MDDLQKEARQKALSLLNYMDRTEFQLRQKLQQKFDDESVAEDAVQYVKSFGYVNDVSYAERYILNKRNSKSKKEIHMALSQKGVSREDIQHAIEQCYEAEGEMEVLQRLCKKKHFSAEDSSEVEKHKIYGYLVRKGFRSEEVRKILNL